MKNLHTGLRYLMNLLVGWNHLVSIFNSRSSKVKRLLKASLTSVLERKH